MCYLNRLSGFKMWLMTKRYGGYSFTSSMTDMYCNIREQDLGFFFSDSAYIGETET